MFKVYNYLCSITSFNSFHVKTTYCRSRSILYNRCVTQHSILYVLDIKKRQIKINNISINKINEAFNQLFVEGT